MWKILRATTSLMCGIHKKAAVSAAKQTAVLLQRTFGAAAFQSGFHLLRVRGAVCAAENHLPPSGLGDATANTR